MSSMTEIKRLAHVKGLKGVSLYRNPISEGENQSDYIKTLINVCQNLESLDHVPVEQIWEKNFGTEFPQRRGDDSAQPRRRAAAGSEDRNRSKDRSVSKPKPQEKKLSISKPLEGKE